MLANHWKLLLYFTIFMTTLHMSSHGTQDLYPTFLQREWGILPKQRALLSAISMVGGIAGALTIGFLSERFGRRLCSLERRGSCVRPTPYVSAVSLIPFVSTT
jgi:SHS family lactate transporter-like MFS transporter